MAPSMNALIAARAVAGMGGGGSVHFRNSSSEISIIVTFNPMIPIFQCHDR